VIYFLFFVGKIEPNFVSAKFTSTFLFVKQSKLETHVGEISHKRQIVASFTKF